MNQVKSAPSRDGKSNWPSRIVRSGKVVVVMAALWFGAASASSQEVEDLLTPRLSPEAIQSAFPGAEEVGAAVGRPASLPVYVGGELVGYLFSTRDTVNTIGYSGFSFDLVAGVTLDGTITGTYMMNHREPIIGHGVPEELLTQYLGGFAAVTLGDARSISAIKPDHLRGATTTARLTRNGVLDAARLVYAGQVDGLFAPVTEPELDRIGFSAHSWEELIAGGSVTKYVLSNAQAEKMFARQVGRGALPDTSTDGPDDTFIEMYVGLVSATSIGSNLFGGPRFKGYLKDAPDDGLAVWIGGRGGFSWMGNAFYRAANRYEFDRVRIVQNDTEIVLTRDMFKRVKVANVPGSYMYESLVFFLPPGAGLDPLAPWHVEVTIPGTDGDGAAAALTVQVAYQLPERHMLLPPPPPPPVWLEAWTDKRAEISILVGMLMVLTLIFLFQDYLVRQRRVFSFVRVGFLAFTLGWLGYYAGGQLSIVNIMAYIQAPFTGAIWSYFLLDPIIFIVTIYVALTLFILGRGVFCGWLCPFGAFQELLAKAAKILRVPQIKIGRTIQERMWAVKYLAAITVIGLAFYSVDLAGTATEMEPFKTAITSRFGRTWPFVLYAGGVLVSALVLERCFCRFLCPLGGSLGVLGRIHMFTWLRRRPQCGTQCRICEADCAVGAIDASGEINLNECLQCMDCQVNYYSDSTCPPLIQRRKRKEKRAVAKPRIVSIPERPPIPAAAE